MLQDTERRWFQDGTNGENPFKAGYEEEEGEREVNKNKVMDRVGG
jgi:hypothetical protein